MNIGFKARELLIEVTGKVEIIHDPFVKALTRNEKWDAWWIWRYQHCRYATI